MVRITAITAVGATRRALQAGLQPRVSLASVVRSYSSVDSSFSVHTPKATKRRKQSAFPVNKSRPGRSAQRSTPGSSASSSSSQNGRLLALGPAQHAMSSGAMDSQLQALERAIDGQDLASIWSVWQDLGPNTTKLGRSGHDKLLTLCTDYVSNHRAASQSQHWQQQMVAFADAASLTGDIDIISRWLRILYASGQFDQIVHIWQKIVHARLNHGPQAPPVSEEPESMQAGRGEAEGFVRIDESSDGERIDIHDMVCIVAFATLKSSRASQFANLFDKVEFGSPFRLFFNMTRAKRLLDSLPTPKGQAIPTDWNSVQPIIWNVELARGLSSGSGGPQRIARLLGSLFQLRQTEEAYTIFRTAMDATSQTPAWLQLEKPGDADPLTQRASWTESCWSVCLSNFIASGRTDLAMKVWTEFQQRRLRPGPRIWNALLDGYGRAKNYTAAISTWSSAIKQADDESGSTRMPDELMFTTMINIYFKAKRIDEAMSLFAEMKARGTQHGGKLNLQAETYNAVIHGLCVNNYQLQARAVLDEMLAKGPSPNIGTINTFLRSHARIGDLASLASTLRLADQLSLTPDVVTFTTVLDALLRNGGESATESVVKSLSIMTSMGVQANAVTYTAMIKACLVGAEAVQLDAASNTMLGDSLDRSRRSQSITNKDVKIEAVLELLNRMMEARVAPTEITYTAIIGGVLQNPDAVAHSFRSKTIPKQYCALPKPMQSLGETSQTIQRWAQETPDVSLALLLLEQMKARNLAPTPITFRSLIEGLCSVRTDHAAFVRSMHLIDDMLLRPPPSQTSRQLGPFVSIVLTGKEASPPTLHPSGYTAWIVIFSSLIDRLENGPRDKAATAACARALNTAIRLVRHMGSLSGAEGGMSLSRVFERAASLTAHLPR